MILADLVNAAFEFLAAVFILNHTRAMLKSGQAYGVSLLSTAFFAAWGAWNIFYYPHIGQTASFYAGILVFFANIIWVSTIIYIRRKGTP